jgi:hypothetical protein
MLGVLDYLSKNYVADFANYLGILLTIIGFAITIHDVRKSKKSIDAAKSEIGIQVNKVREDIRRIDTVSDLTTAIAMMDEIRVLQRDCQWQILPDRYSSLRKLIISIKKTYPQLSDNQKVILQEALQHITDIDLKIEKSMIKNNAPSDIPTINRILSQQKDNVYEMLIELRNNIGVN